MVTQYNNTEEEETEEEEVVVEEEEEEEEERQASHSIISSHWTDDALAVACPAEDGNENRKVSGSASELSAVTASRLSQLLNSVGHHVGASTKLSSCETAEAAKRVIKPCVVFTQCAVQTRPV